MPESVNLRVVLDSDLPIFYEQQLDPQANFMAAFTTDDPTDRARFDAHWAKIRANSANITRTIVFDDKVAGHIASYIDADFGKREVTYWLGKEFWGKGIAGKALAAYLDEITVRPIYGRAASDNAASMRVMQKCGFQLIGYDTGFATARNAVIEEAIFELK